MSFTRSELRRLRNKVYVRILSRQSIQKHLDNYQNLAQVYIKKFERKLDEEELVAIKSRVEVKKEAAAAAFTRARDDSLGDQILHRLGRLSSILQR